MRALGFVVVLGTLAATACTPDVATTSSSGGGGGATSSTGSVVATSDASTGSGATTTAATTSSAASTSSSATSTSASTGSAMPVWGPCGGFTDSFMTGANWATLGNVSFGGSATIQGSASLTSINTIPTDGCFVSFRLPDANFAGDAALSLEVDGSVVAYSRADGNIAFGGLTSGPTSQTSEPLPSGLGVAFMGGYVWFLVKHGSDWKAIGSTNAVLGESVVRIVATGPGAAGFDIDELGDPIPLSALN